MEITKEFLLMKMKHIKIDYRDTQRNSYYLWSVGEECFGVYFILKKIQLGATTIHINLTFKF